jgi:glycosyltransferase involved in cell wall biosynthesis
MRRLHVPPPIRAVALLDPVADAGIGGYTHELATALEAAGVRTAVYSAPGGGFAARLPRTYALRGAFGAAPVAVPADVPVAAAGTPAPGAASGIDADARAAGPLDAYLALLRRRATAPAAVGAAGTAARGAPGPAAHSGTGPSRRGSEDARACAAFAAHLASEGFDTVWTQWPDLSPYGPALRPACAARGMRLVHTVHNVVPHEPSPGDLARHAEVYAGAGALVVHSAQAADDLARRFPGCAGRVVRSLHGTYSLYERAPHLRAGVRRALGVPDEAVVTLAFGGVRPYKNVEALVAAVAATPGALLVVAGWEWGYAAATLRDRLAHTRQVVDAAGVGDRVRLLPGPFGVPQTAALFEACDIVALPYAASSGSGVLCLAMTYGRHVLCTPVGGMAEYAGGYDAATVAAGSSVEAVAAALSEASAAVRRRGARPSRPPGRLAWPRIVDALLQALPARFAA